MKRMSDILLEIKKDQTHPDGTYISALLSKKSQGDLDNWVSTHNITNPSDPKEYHTTVIYSKVGVPKARTYDLGLPIEASIKEWKLFDTQTGTKCLVGVVDSKELTKHHETIKDKFGATHGFPEYHPHITVSYDYKGDLLREIPNFKVTFDKSEFKPLDPEFVPPTKD